MNLIIPRYLHVKLSLADMNIIITKGVWEAIKWLKHSSHFLELTSCVKFNYAKVKTETLSLKSVCSSWGPVAAEWAACLRAAIMVAAIFLVLLHCLHTSLSACLLYPLACMLVLYKVAVYVSGCVAFGAGTIWYPAEGPPSPAGCQGGGSLPAAIDLRHAEVSRHLSTPTPTQWCDTTSTAHHNALLVNYKLGKITETTPPNFLPYPQTWAWTSPQ